jgi:hypothetical protein
MITKKSCILVVCLLLLTTLLLCIIHVIPNGLGGIKPIFAYIFFSLDRGVYTSPCGTSLVRVVSNDAGAMHSGHFLTWVLEQHWWGEQVVARGFLESSRGPVPLVWLDETSFSITFAKNRYGDDLETVVVQLR